MAKNTFLWFLIYFFQCISPALSQIDLNQKFYLAQAVAAGKAHVDVMLAIKSGRGKELVRYLEENKIPIKFYDKDLEYIRVTVPIKNIDVIVDNPAVAAAELEGRNATFYQELTIEPRERVSSKKINIAEKIRNNRLASDPFDYEAMRLLTLRHNVPSADGRGVTIAFVETFIDPSRPEFSEAKTWEGRKIKKIAGLYEANNYMASVFPAADTTPSIGGVRLHKVTVTGSGIADFGGRKLRVDGAGQYLVGLGAARSGYLEKNPEEVPDKDKILIVRKVGERCFYIDADQNGDIRDEKCIEDYNKTGVVVQLPQFGDENSERRLFLLETAQPEWVVLGTPGSHTHFVSATAVGNNFFGASLAGTAPSAQLIVIAAGISTVSYLEAYIRAAHDPRVDIIFRTVGFYELAGSSGAVSSIIVDRIVERKNKIILDAAGNNSNLSVLPGRFPVSEHVLSVGQFLSRRMKKAIYMAEAEDSAALASSGGPALDGRIKPDIIAPSHLIAPTASHNRQMQGFLCWQLILPERSDCVGGTSTATPSAVGGVASLLGALRSNGVSPKAVDIVRAIRATARHIPTIPVYLQGNGVLDLQAAFDYMMASGNEKIKIDVRANIENKYYRLLFGDILGRGLFEREGWSPGSRGVRNISLTRQTGAPGDMLVDVILVGNDQGTFAAPSEVRLPLQRNIALPIEIVPRRDGVHSAALELRNKQGTLLERISLTIVAAVPLSEAKRLFRRSVELTGTRGDHTYISIPPGTTALSVAFQPSDTYSFLLPLRGALGGVEPSLSQRRGVMPDLASYTDRTFSGGYLRQGVLWPTPGVWEIGLHVYDVYRESAETVAEVEIITDKMLNDPRQAKGEFAEAVFANDADFQYRRVVGARFSGEVALERGALPLVMPLRLPDGARTIDARIWQKTSDKQAGRGLALTLIECAPSECFVRSAAIGENRAATVARADLSKKWYIAAASIDQQGGPVLVEYEIFVAVDQVGREPPGTNADTDSVVPNGQLIDVRNTGQISLARELINQSFELIEYENLPLTHSQVNTENFNVILSREYIPLGRKWGDCVGNVVFDVEPKC